MGETFGGGIDRQHEAALGTRLTFVRENHELARHELAAVIVAHRPGDEQQLAFPDLALEERLTRPGTLERATAALVAEDRPEYPKSLASGEHPRAHDAADARRLLAHLHLVQGRDRRGVEIPMGGVVQQVPDASDTEPCERLRTLRPHALQVLHRCSELEGHPPMSLRANRSAANTSRSPRPSPVPRKRIGTCTARSSATTLPPFAVPSSFVTISPVSGTAAAKARAWCTAFCPTVASTTSNDSCGAPGCCFAITRTTFFSSSSSRSSVWSRPAVSTSTVSTARARAAAMASKATAAGSFVPVTHGTPSRPAQICSCSAAPARNVSAAANSTDRPPRASRAPSFATADVLPTPFTPKIRRTVGGTGARASAPGSPPGDPGVSSWSTARSSAAWKGPSPAPETRSRICSVASTPKSASSRMRSASVRWRARSPPPNTRASRSHRAPAIRASPRAAATPTRRRTPRWPR